MTSKANVSRSGTLRREIAAAAARMMAEDGIGDFGFAKRKAARQLGATDADALPTNAEIEAELRAWQTLFQDEEHPRRLLQMRRTAVEVMRLLAPFQPYLTGGALDGTAGRYSEVEIELYPESSKDVEIFLLNHGMAYDLREPRRPAPYAAESILSFEWDDVPFKLSIYDEHAARAGRRPAERARLAAVEALVNDSLEAAK